MALAVIARTLQLFWRQASRAACRCPVQTRMLRPPRAKEFQDVSRSQSPRTVRTILPQGQPAYKDRVWKNAPMPVPDRPGFTDGTGLRRRPLIPWADKQAPQQPMKIVEFNFSRSSY